MRVINYYPHHQSSGVDHAHSWSDHLSQCVRRVAIYGEAEFIFASLKIITIVGLIILTLILDLGGGPNHDRLGFRFWKHPGAMKEYQSKGSTGRFLGLFSVFVNAAFSYGGVEFVALAAGESRNPRKNIPKVVRRIFWRILVFYSLGALAVGVLVPYDDENLLSAQSASIHTAAASPWVIAIQRAGIPASRLFHLSSTPSF
ncbi:Proline-specific permease [Exophiala dermatitidis]